MGQYQSVNFHFYKTPVSSRPIWESLILEYETGVSSLGGGIWTHSLLLPKQARYQVTLRPVIFNYCGGRVRKKTYVVIIYLLVFTPNAPARIWTEMALCRRILSPPCIPIPPQEQSCPSRTRTCNILINSQLFCLWTMGQKRSRVDSNHYTEKSATGSLANCSLAY